MADPVPDLKGKSAADGDADFAALRQSGDAILRRLFDSATDHAICLLSPRGTIVSWNAGAQRIMGYSAAEAIGRHGAMLHTPEALATGWPDEALRRACEDGRLEDEGWRVRKDGTRFWANVVISPLIEPDGRVAGFTEITRDLTERRAQEKRLRDSERNLRLLVEGVQDYAIFTLDPHGVITSWNLGAERIKGYTATEAIGKHFSMFYPAPAVAARWPQQELQRAKTFGRFEDEGWRLRKDGSRFWANVVITAIVDDQGTLLGFSKVTRDLTERRRHEEELMERERNFRLLVDGVKDHAMFLLDRNGRIRTWNTGAQRVLGYRAEQVLGHDVSMLYTEHDQASGRPTVELAAATEAGAFRAEGWRQRADGTTFWAEVSSTALFDDARRLQGFVRIVRDLTERRRVEALENEGRRINEFIALLSHELRNPLAPIQNAVAVLGKAAQSAEMKWCVDVIGRQAALMKRLVDDLLDVSRITSGKIRIDKKPLDLNALVAQAVDAMRATAAERGHGVTVQAAPQPLMLAGDATRLNQVLVNLLVNAIKFTPPNGHITVTVEDRGTTACVQVIDDGVGMSESLLRHAFEPFVQGAGALDRPEGGLGIGLTLVKSIVELHGGSVAAASRGPGHGTTITLSLPFPADETTPEPQQEQPESKPPPKTVLIVDDNRDAADSLAMLLRIEGHDVHVAADGADALAQARRLQPHVAVLDIGLPKMDGYELARRLRRLPGPHGLRLIAVTGYGQNDDLRASTEAGFEQHLVKPIDPAELSRIIG
ncbi:MAG: PAS domain S-box protein [Burkholderiaceae bacterium]|nr:PAS domain S-box protein [Burkholderiaceae bacterium]